MIKIVDSNPNRGREMHLAQQFNNKTPEIDLSHQYLIPTSYIQYLPNKSKFLVRLQDTKYDFVEINEKDSIQKEIYFTQQNDANFLCAMIASRHNICDEGIKICKSGEYRILDCNSKTIKQIFVNNQNQFSCSVIENCSMTQKIIEFASKYHIPLNLIEFSLNDFTRQKIPIKISDYTIFVNCNQYKSLFTETFNCIARISDLKKRIIQKMKIQKVKRRIIFLYKNAQIKDDEILCKFANDQIDIKIDIELTFSFYSDGFFEIKRFFPIDSKFVDIKNNLLKEINVKHHQYFKNYKTLKFYTEDTNDLIHPNDTIRTIGFKSKIIAVNRNEAYFQKSLKIMLIKLFYFIFFNLWICLYNNIFNNWETSFTEEELKNFEQLDEFIKDTENNIQFQIESNAYTKWINSKIKEKNKQIKNTIELTKENNFSLLIETIWGDKIKNNQKSINKYFKNTHNIDINELNLDLANDLHEIIWHIIYKDSIKWINYDEEKGENGLLKWLRDITNKYILNFYDDWKDGTMLCLLLSHFYPNEINHSIINKNDASINVQKAIEILEKKEIPLYFDYENFMQNKNEKIILLQCATLFDYFTSTCLHNVNDLLNNELNNCEPDFDSGRISEIELNESKKKDIIVQLNNHFQKVLPSRHPVLVASIINSKPKFYYKSFINVIKRAGSRPIIGLAVNGRFQRGKSTVISGLTGNYGYEIGDGINEQTKGIYIDGPYDIEYLYERFEINARDSIYFLNNKLLSPLVFFFDIEGNGVNADGNFNEEYIKMCIPFLCISSVFLFLSDTNPNVNEIQKFLEQIKISNLTTYSNDFESNGLLKLLVVLNKHYPEITNLKEDEENLQNNCHKNWNGNILLKKFGINYDFQPIVAYSPCFGKELFYESFQNFAHAVIRSIENATEGSFIRCGEYTIKLFNYIIQHFDQPLFDQRIKKIIKNYHENSYETIAYNALQLTYKAISPKINLINKNLYDNLSINYSFNEVSDEIIKTSEDEINKYLFKVKDKNSVFKIIMYFKQSMIKISQIIYNKYKTFKINEINKCFLDADGKANECINELIHSFHEEFKKRKLLDSQISKYIDYCVNQIIIKLQQYKEEKKLILLTDEMIEKISENKRNLIIDEINEIIQNIENEIHHVQLVSQTKAMIHNEIMSYYNNLCQLLISNKIDELRTELSDIEYYKSNYKSINNMIENIQKIILDEMNSKRDEAIINACNLVKNDIGKSRIVDLLLNDRQKLYTENDIQLLVLNFQSNLREKIIDEFNAAREKHVEIIREIKRELVSPLSIKIYEKITKKYPDDEIITGEFVLLRTERAQNSDYWETLQKCYSVISSFRINLDGNGLINVFNWLRHFFTST